MSWQDDIWTQAQQKKSAKGKSAPKIKAVTEPSGSYAEGVYCLTAPIKVVSEANLREHWAAKNKRKAAQQVALRLYWGQYVQKLPSPPMMVIFTRIGQRKLDDDNLANAFKGLRDQFAKMVGVDDGSDQIRFEYRQIATGKRQYGIQVEVKET